MRAEKENLRESEKEEKRKKMGIKIVFFSTRMFFHVLSGNFSDIHI